VLDAERAAGDGVRKRDVEGAVVVHHWLDLDAVGADEPQPASEEPDRGRGALLVEDLDASDIPSASKEARMISLPRV
jgi:hypothetical protein